MDKVFSNKKLAYALVGILSALQLTQSIANWVGGGFNGGSLILCILMLGLLILVGVGISKKNKLLTIVSGVSILSVVIYILASNYSGLIQEWIDGKLAIGGLVSGIFASLATFLLIGNFVLIILKTFNLNKNLTKLCSVFSIIAVLFFLATIIAPIASGQLASSQHEAWQKVLSFARDFFGIFIALLIPCVWHQLDVK